jgi:hypothetical protein
MFFSGALGGGSASYEGSRNSDQGLKEKNWSFSIMASAVQRIDNIIKSAK